MLACYDFLAEHTHHQSDRVAVFFRFFPTAKFDNVSCNTHSLSSRAIAGSTTIAPSILAKNMKVNKMPMSA